MTALERRLEEYWNNWKAAEAGLATAQVCIDHLQSGIKRAVREGDLRLTVPCIICGYSGPGFYQPKTHACAALSE